MEKVIDSGIKAVRSYSTRGYEKKLLADAIKSSKSTTKRIRLKKTVVMKNKNAEVVVVREDESIDPDIFAENEKKRQEIHDSRRTRSFISKSDIPVLLK